jgi:hypothetical protein
MKEVSILLYELHGFQLLERGLFGDLVFRSAAFFLEVSGVRNISDVTDLIAQVEEITVNEIEGNKRARVSQVALAADGWSTHIHSYVAGCKGGENLFLSCIRIVDF